MVSADAGMSPVELFVGSVAGCVGYFCGWSSRTHISARLKVEAEWTMAEQLHRVGQIHLLRSGCPTGSRRN
ncbi:MAG: OsmC family protein [Nitrospira sp.]|nr:OsmC family protein [Nitrospira sp.]